MSLTVTVLILAGAALLFLETLLPGMVAGFVGFGCLVAAVVLTYLHFGAQAGHWMLLGVVLGCGVGVFCWFKYFPDSAIARKFIDRGAIGLAQTEDPRLLNQTGVAATDLRPAGTALINGKRLDVVSDGEYIERGRPIRVVEVQGLRVVVRAESPATAAGSAA